MLTELGRSQVEDSAVPSAVRPLQLRSSSAHCVRKLAKSLAKRWQGGSEHGSGCKGGGGEAGGEGGGGEEVEDEEEEETEEENNCDKI